MLSRSFLVKVVVLGVLVAMLAVPLLAIWVIGEERASRRRDVVKDLTGVWGGRQTIAGPILSIPFTVVGRDGEGKESRFRDVIRVLPAALDIQARADVQTRRRGIYDVPVYTLTVKLAGRFHVPDLAYLGVGSDSVQWSAATVSVGGFELKAVLPEFSVTLDGRAVAAEPDTDMGLWPAGIAVSASSVASGQPGREVPFEVTLPLRGSESLAFVPVGQTSTVACVANWPSPSFEGASLPERRTVSDSGFTARWRASSLGRSVPRAWRDSQIVKTSAAERLDGSRFGVSLVTPVDVYTESGRATKYGVLFVLLTFLAFFLVEVLQPASVHPVQYLLVGAALCIFYLLLLSLAEQIGFTPAYLISAAATTVLIASYSRFALGSRRSTAQVGAGLAALYGFLYVLLRQEDYALLIGSIALFAILAGVMYLTRKVDWYAAGSARA
jgi:inner membrane protein